MATAVLSNPILTVEEYLQRNENLASSELVRGRVVEMPPTKMGHGVICGTIAWLLRSFLELNRLGRIATNDSGVLTQRNPDTLRGADVAFYSFHRVPASVDLFDKYPAASPELIFEVKSPSDSWPDIAEKVAEYLQVGVDVVCVIDPEQRVAVVHAADAPPRTLSADQVLEFPKILPGFQAGVGQLLA